MKRLAKKNKGRLKRDRWVCQTILQVLRDEKDTEAIKKFIKSGKQYATKRLF